jgi:hypothetical protein
LVPRPTPEARLQVAICTPGARPRKKHRIGVSSGARLEPAPINPSRHPRFHSVLPTAFILTVLADPRTVIKEVLPHGHDVPKLLDLALLQLDTWLIAAMKVRAHVEPS